MVRIDGGTIRLEHFIGGVKVCSRFAEQTLGRVRQ